MQMWYAFWDPRDVETEIAITQFANMCRRMRAIVKRVVEPLSGKSKSMCGFVQQPAGY